MRWLLKLVLNAFIFILLAHFLNGIYISGFGAALGASLLLSFLNMVVRPILIFLTLPVTILTLGLFILVINAATLMLTDGLMGEAFEIAGFGTALVASLVMALLNIVMNKLLKEDKS
ncbi:putative membrane protein [Peribacillus deserti]|uniref:Membrane protein n=1 Tax=Peribacillus deserti TaxID=673318 RepID=A0ABS2QD92_9BACI|nr:phage holin family protein [Peribacillus deserti]MBM7690955.1 putative membrane protein [Peribacillus deserti]